MTNAPPFPFFSIPYGSGGANQIQDIVPVLRKLPTDLLCGVGGFALGAAALLLTNGAGASAPAPAKGDTNILSQIQAADAPQAKVARRG